MSNNINFDAIIGADKKLEEKARRERAELFVEADIMVNKALDSGQDLKPFSDYRQALRDVTNQSGFPKSFKWPNKPG